LTVACARLVDDLSRPGSTPPGGSQDVPDPGRRRDGRLCPPCREHV